MSHQLPVFSWCLFEVQMRIIRLECCVSVAVLSLLLSHCVSPSLSTLLQADGGSPITVYTLEWSRAVDYCTIDGSVDIPSTSSSYTLQVR